MQAAHRDAPSFITKRNEWIDSRGSTGGQVGGEKRHAKQQQDCGGEWQRVVRGDLEEQRTHEPRAEPGAEDAGRGADDRPAPDVPEHHAENISRAGPERHADADLLRLPYDDKADYSVDSDCREPDTYRGE